MYHPTITKLDHASIELYPVFPAQSKQLAIIAGEVQTLFNERSPFGKNRRFLDAQWCWALGHIGILYQVIRWFHLKHPHVKLVLETQGKVANRYFLNALAPLITIVDQLPEHPNMVHESQYNAVYFACPDGVHHVHDFMKIAEKECEGVNLLSLSDGEEQYIGGLLEGLNVQRPYVAIQARHMDYDPKRNVSVEQCEKALKYYTDLGYSVVSTGLDKHPINDKYPSVLNLPDPFLASFLLSASCDQFIGSDSGAWTVPWAFRRPVELMNDEVWAAWIYP